MKDPLDDRDSRSADTQLRPEPVSGIARSLASAADTRSVLEYVAEAALDFAGASGAYVEQVLDPPHWVEVLAATGGATPPVGTRVPFPGSLTEEIIRGGVPLLLDDLTGIGKDIAPYIAEGCSACSILVTPLMWGHHVMGALVLLRTPEHGPFDPGLVGHVRTLGDLAAVSLQHLRLAAEGRAERERMAAILDATGDGIYGLDADGHCTFVNPAAAAMLGYEPDELLGRNMHALIHHSHENGTHYPREKCPIHEALRSDGGVQVENDILWRKDGTFFPAEYGSSPIRENGSVTGAVITFRDVSHRKGVETAVRESEQRFRGLAENAADAIVTIDPDDRIAYANPAVEQVFGYTLEELGELHFTALMPERYRADHRAAVLRLARTHERRIPWDGIELPGLHKDGHEIPLEITFGAFESQGRQFFTGIMRDISERKRADAERERLLERERFLAEATAVFASSIEYTDTLRTVAHLTVPGFADYCLIDLLEEGRLRRVAFAHADPEKEPLLGADRSAPPAPGSESPALRALETGRPQFIPEVQENWLHAAAQGEEHLELMRLLAPRSAIIVPLVARESTLGIIWFARSTPGATYHVEDLDLASEVADRAALAVDNARLYRDAQTARGEAERRAKEEAALREATAAVSASASTEEVIRRIAGSAVQATNADGAFVERIDIASGEVAVVAAAGDHVPTVGGRLPYDGSFAQQVVENAQPILLDRLADAQHHVPVELATNHPDDAAIVLPLVNGGEPIGALTLVRGAHKRSFRSDEVRRAHTFAQLAALAFRKIHMLEESERRREELQRVMESRARLMRGFSHDVKNPLGAADGFLSLLLDGIVGALTDKQSEHVARARRAIGNSLKLIEDLLDLARAEAGQIELEWGPLDLRDAVRELGEEYRAQADAKGLRLEVDLPPEFPVVESDPSRVRQIVGNLVSNSVKYTDHGWIRISVPAPDAVREQRGGEWVAAVVSDSGPGISPDKQQLLFQEFTRLDPGAKKGAGVGLAISQRLAVALEGEITVSSQPGEGSTFTLWLPCRRGEQADDARPAPPPPNGDAPAAP